MNLLVFATSLLTALVACATATVGHDKVQPFPQSAPVTIAEKDPLSSSRN
ncbi:hypothetical protein PC128_g2406 [Phytophthora cactorum]|nr:hypothetical protein PC128_g2406 [Phytophthora cactorum]